MNKRVKKIAVFASGSGTNAENLARYFAGSDCARVELVLTNNTTAGVIARAKNLGIPCFIFNGKQPDETDETMTLLIDKQIDLIVLAGFLKLIPEKLIRAFEKKIINIHPALLPGFGGKGFYGINVHQKVIEANSILSGITIHYVNEKFDAGEIIFQAACHISQADTAESLSKKIHQLEYRYFPVVIEKLLMQSDHSS